MKEGHLRSIVKAVSWRLCATLTTIVIVYMFTRKLVLAFEIGAIEMIAKLTFYYFHERLWSKIRWGNSNHPLADIPVKKNLSLEEKKKVEEHLKSLGYM